MGKKLSNKEWEEYISKYDKIKEKVTIKSFCIVIEPLQESNLFIYSSQVALSNFVDIVYPPTNNLMK